MTIGVGCLLGVRAALWNAACEPSEHFLLGGTIRG